MKLTIGSRGSQLALWQARHIEAALQALGHQTRIEIIRTTGDRITDVALSKVGSKGLFTKELEDALLDGSIDLAVHSLKDMPTSLPDGLAIAAVPEREDPRDAVIGKRLDQLAPGSRVGTSSLRRSAQLQATRRDLVVESVRGNLDTRLRKLDDGLYDAILLAAAGLRRLGWQDRIAELLPSDKMCPAVGQGALCIETRQQGDARDACAPLEHSSTRAAVDCERALLAALGGGCQVPIGAHATISEPGLNLIAIVAAPDGSRIVRASGQGPASTAAVLGERVARDLLAQGARELLAPVL